MHLWWMDVDSSLRAWKTASLRTPGCSAPTCCFLWGIESRPSAGASSVATKKRNTNDDWADSALDLISGPTLSTTEVPPFKPLYDFWPFCVVMDVLWLRAQQFSEVFSCNNVSTAVINFQRNIPEDVTLQSNQKSETPTWNCSWDLWHFSAKMDNFLTASLSVLSSKFLWPFVMSLSFCLCFCFF